MLLKRKTNCREPRDARTTSNDTKTKVHAQRKFAQGSPSFISHKDREREHHVTFNHHHHHPVIPAPSETFKEGVPDLCPNTEDFLTFLCLRGTSLLPESLKIFSAPYRPSVAITKTNKSAALNQAAVKPERNIVAASKPVNQKKSSPIKSQSKEGNIPKMNDQPKPLPPSKPIPIKQKKGLAPIHSNFSKRMGSSKVLTRLLRSRADNSTDKHMRNIPIKGIPSKPKKDQKQRIATRSQRRGCNVKVSSSSSTSSSESSESDSESSESDSNIVIKSPTKSKRFSEFKKSTPISAKKSANKLEPPKKSIEKAKSKTTRQSSSKSATTVHSPFKKNYLNQQSKKSPAESLRQSTSVQRKSLRHSPVKAVQPTGKRSSLSPSKNSPQKITREAARKIRQELLAQIGKIRKVVETASSHLQNRCRPSRRTKEAATLNMTLIGHEERDSSDPEDSEDHSVKIRDQSKKAATSKSAPNSAKSLKRPSDNLSSPGVTTRRSTRSSSPAAKRRMILREAAKRFTAAQSSSSEDSSSSSNSSGNSSSEDEADSTSVRNIRTRSFDPVQAQRMTRSAPQTSKTTQVSRETRSGVQKKALKTDIISSKKPKTTRSTVKSTSKSDDSSSRSDDVSKSNSPGKKNVVKRPDTPPLNHNLDCLIEAPVFQPSEKEFADPMEYLEKIRPECERFGICRIVPPPSFKPECEVSDAMRFTAYNQYIHRMFRRKGINSRHLNAIHRHLTGMDINCHPPPCIGGIEVDLYGLYQAVQELGGPKTVLEDNLWPKVADMLKIPRASQDKLSKLDTIYCKYLLPYATLSNDERQKLLQKVDSMRRSDDNEEEECVVKGSSIALNTFYRIARNTSAVWFPNQSTTSTDCAKLDTEQVEETYWKITTERTAHVCVHSGNIDSGQAGYGFPCSKTARHPWNLKVLTNNNSSVLRSLGPVMGVTVPTLHVGMLFSASCWYRDPHGLPWIDYLHTGAEKIWYGVPSVQEPILRRAMTKLVPDLVQTDKSVWLSSDTVMVPPTMLAHEGVSLSRTVQKSGQYIVVWPRAFTSSLCTGYTVSESVYFAPVEWLPIGDSCFKESRLNCEPTVFSMQQLLWSIAHDTRSNADVLKWLLPILQRSIDEELEFRDNLRDFGVNEWEKILPPESRAEAKKRRPPAAASADEDETECDICRASLFFSRVECQVSVNSCVTWCLLHALQKIKDRPRLTPQARVFFTHDEDELRQCLRLVQDSIQSKPLKRTSTHHRSSTL